MQLTTTIAAMQRMLDRQSREATSAIPASQHTQVENSLQFSCICTWPPCSLCEIPFYKYAGEARVFFVIDGH